MKPRDRSLNSIELNIYIFIYMYIIGKSDLTDKMKRSFFDTAVWMHYLDAKETAGEEARRQLHKNAASNIKQVLAANTQQDNNYTATCLPSQKLSKHGEAGTNS